MAGMFNSKFFTNNRRKLHEKIGDDSLVVVTAQSLLQRSGDTTYPFRQDSNFYYLTGVNEPDVVLVMCGGEEFFILPKRTEVENIFGGTINSDEIAKNSGVMTIYSHTEGWDRYKKLQQSSKKLYTIGAAPTKVVHTDSFFTNPARRSVIQKIKRLAPDVSIIDIRHHLTDMRMIKQPEEIAAIKAAIDITRRGFNDVKEMLADGISERQIHAVFDNHFRQCGGVHGYEPIVASGKNSCVLHYIKNDQTMQAGDVLLLDVGAEIGNYSADISRTFFVGDISKRQSAVYEAVLDVQKQAIKLLRPGLAWRDWSLAVNKLIGEKLVQLGLIKRISPQAVRRYFPHGIGHSLGLDGHDVCDYKIIKENMIITVEPGIYIPEEAIGVRIEDDILITKNGAKNLSADIIY